MGDTNLGTSNESYEFVLSSNKSYVEPNDSFVVTLTLSNTLPYDITNITARVSIGVDASFVKGTATIDGVSYPSVNVTEFFSIPKTLASGGSPIVVQFLALTDSDAYDTIYLIGSIRFTIQGIQATGETNQLEVDVVDKTISVTQTASKSVVVSGQTLTYNFVVKNDGNITHKSLFFVDEIPSSETFVEGSVKIGSKTYASANPITGFSMSNLLPNSIARVSFDVLIN